MKVIDLFCGLGGWAKGFIEKGHEITGYDIIDFSQSYPGKFIKADLLTLNKFPKANVIVASPLAQIFLRHHSRKPGNPFRDSPLTFPTQ